MPAEDPFRACLPSDRLLDIPRKSLKISKDGVYVIPNDDDDEHSENMEKKPDCPRLCQTTKYLTEMEEAPIVKTPYVDSEILKTDGTKHEAPLAVLIVSIPVKGGGRKKLLNKRPKFELPWANLGQFSSPPPCTPP